jgi:hypothetical protein
MFTIRNTLFGGGIRDHRRKRDHFTVWIRFGTEGKLPQDLLTRGGWY